MNTLRAKQIDFSKIVIGDAKTNDNGNKSAYIGYNGEQFFVQTPPLRVAFTMSKFGADKDAKPEFVPGVVEKYGLQMTLNESCKSTKYFSDFVKALDKKVIAAGVTGSAKWFKKVYSKEVIETFYSSTRADYKDKETGEISDKYPATFKVNIPVKDGKIDTKCVDEDGNDITVEFPIRKGAIVTAILQISSVWFVGNNKFGTSMRPTLLKVTQSKNDFKSFKFQEDSDTEDVPSEHASKNEFIESSDDERPSDHEEHEEATTPAAGAGADAIADDELPAEEPEPEEDDDDAEEEVKPPPKVIKRVVKKK